MEKRGQITIFIIVAILLIATIGFYYIFKNDLGSQGSLGEYGYVYSFVEECIKEVGTSATYYVSQNGGYFIPSELSNEEGIPYYYYSGQSYLPSKENIANEISEYVNEMLFFCTQNFVEFNGLNISQGEINTQAVIEEEEIVFNIEYPVIIRKGEDTTVIRDFENIKIFNRLGTIYNVASEIIEKQKGNNDTCLSCSVNLAVENDLYVDMSLYENNSVLFTVEDQDYSPFLKFKFINKYD
jgi:hypothetical protein